MALTFFASTGEGIVTSRAVMRRPEEDRWNLDEAKDVKATPWDLLQRSDVETLLTPMAEKLDEFADKESNGPRRFKITRRDLDGVGFTRGCQQCEHIPKDGAGRGGLQRSERRRARGMKELSKTPAGKARVDRAEERITKALVEMSGDVERKWPSQTGTSAAAPPGFPGTIDGTVINTEDAVPAAGGRAMASESMDPARRPGNSGVDEDAHGQGDSGRREGCPHPRDAQVHGGDGEPPVEMDMGFMDGDGVTCFPVG